MSLPFNRLLQSSSSDRLLLDFRLLIPKEHTAKKLYHYVQVIPPSEPNHNLDPNISTHKATLFQVRPGTFGLVISSGMFGLIISSLTGTNSTEL